MMISPLFHQSEYPHYPSLLSLSVSLVIGTEIEIMDIFLFGIFLFFRLAGLERLERLENHMLFKESWEDGWNFICNRPLSLIFL